MIMIERSWALPPHTTGVAASLAVSALLDVGFQAAWDYNCSAPRDGAFPSTAKVITVRGSFAQWDALDAAVATQG